MRLTVKGRINISGAEHKPPEPLEIPSRVNALINWINENQDRNPVILAALAHHEIAAIHPFKDGNGRVSRLLMTLILMRRGFPISNLKRDQRPHYYESLAFADAGIYDPLVRLVKEASVELFDEYRRIREETRRTEEWAKRWGQQEAAVLHRRETTELELWQSRIRQVLLEFQRASEHLDGRLESIEVNFHDFKNAIDFERYQSLLDKGYVERANAFSIRISDTGNNRGKEERFMFRYYRDGSIFPRMRVIPLELNYLDKDAKSYVRIGETSWGNLVRLRYVYFNTDGQFTLRSFDHGKNEERDTHKQSISDAVQMFFDDVLKYVAKIG